MKTQSQSLGALVLALSLIVTPALPTVVEAGQGRHRGQGRGHGPPVHQQRARQEPARHHHGGGPCRDHDRGYSCNSGFWPFVGGVVVGAVIAGQRDSPVVCATPRPVVRVFVYDCAACDYRGGGYEAYCNHLVYQHRVSRCDVTRWHQPYEHGYWEERY